MRKVALFLIVLFLLTILSGCSRYQMINKGYRFYKLDKWTGEVWIMKGDTEEKVKGGIK